MSRRNCILDSIVAAAAGFEPGPAIDIPGGTGIVADTLAPLGFEVCSADLFLGASRPDLIRADMEKPLPFRSASLALAVSSEGIEHISDSYGFLCELGRVVRPGGGLILTTPNVLSLRARLSICLSGQITFRTRVDEVTEVKHEERGRIYHGHVFLRSYFQLRYQLHHAGFRIRAVVPSTISPTAVCLSPMIPLVWLATIRAFPPTGDSAQRERHQQIRKHVISPALLFSKNLILVAAKLDDLRRS